MNAFKTLGSSDPGLVELLFQYGRYLMICGSRPGTLPLNLQGIWNDSVRPPWSSNYTLNINAEMNYWPAETCNLSELHSPLLDFIEDLALSGAKTAREYYGAEGWVAHHNSDIWRHSAPVGDFGEGDPIWAVWQMGGIWLCAHLWEHWLFSRDADFLRNKAWPLMKGAAEFALNWLVETDEGLLTTIPSTSPEHKFRTEEGLCGVSAGSTMDLSLISELMSNCIQASEILDLEPDFREKLESARARLLPPRIGKYGQLMEWAEDFEEEDPHHRHVSHLYSVFPGGGISRDSSPQLLQAARTALERRGGDGTGWSLAWKICLGQIRRRRPGVPPHLTASHACGR